MKMLTAPYLSLSSAINKPYVYVHESKSVRCWALATPWASGTRRTTELFVFPERTLDRSAAAQYGADYLVRC